ncbi:MAG: protease modulator HflC [Xanthomonadaceae bacterium]|jgi:membrane protease subunit HflC|nr:protease modulator HflC [Xanthomonadaceae bacterium]
MKAPVWIIAAVVVLLGLFSSVYVVQESQVGLVMNLGRVVRTDIGPGIHFKIPVIENARVFDRRLALVDFSPERYLTSERKDVSVDFVAIGYISNVGDFYRATGGEFSVATDRLAPIIKDSLRNEINSRTLTQLVSGDRSEFISKQLEGINRGAENLGMTIFDIRLKQIDLPTDSDVITQVYDRMRAERKQVASRLRAEGEEQARTIRAEADRDQAVIVAEAERDAQRLRGEGDAQAARLYGQATKDDAAFYAFYRSLEAYRKSFADGQSIIVLDENDPFLQYLKNDK